MKKCLCRKEGITLIALIITIIVMLILVGVTVSIALNGGLFDTARKAAEGTERATEKEELISISVGCLDSTGNFNKEKFKTAIELKTGYEFEDETNKITTSKGNIFYVDKDGSIVETEPVMAWDGVAKVEVTESENNTYYISNAAELAWLAEEVNGGNSFSGKTIKVTKNIDLGNKEWIPIGRVKTLQSMTPFEGTFDGQGHVISNIKVTSSECENDLALGGIFGVIQNATIQNLGIEDGIIQAYGDEESCTQIGGIVGGAAGTVQISNCYNKKVKIKYIGEDWRQAGIISYCLAGTLTIENCYNTTDFDVIGTEAGILAEVASGATANISNCYNIGKVYKRGSIVENEICTHVDGVVNIENCYTVPFVDKENQEEIPGLTVYANKEDMKGIASNLGSAFKEDTQNINDGYPILIWQ